MTCFIIAEIGVNHNGDIGLAKQMIDQAVDAGVDCVKFQTFVTEELVTRSAAKATYQKETTESSETQYEMLKKLELSFDAFKELKAYCEDKGIEFLSTAFDLKSVEFLDELGMKRWKIPSGEITNLPYLVRIAQTKKPVIISTGMSCMEEIENAVKVFENHGVDDITVLHCTTAYPTPMESVNLNAMTRMGSQLNKRIGYSDHTEGIEVAISAVALGALIIEKHFTLDKNLPGPDQRASTEPDTFKEMVRAIRNIELALGSSEKRVTGVEKDNAKVARKSIFAKVAIAQGECFTEENLVVKRPEIGLSPMNWFDVLGKTAKKSYKPNEVLSEEVLYE